MGFCRSLITPTASHRSAANRGPYCRRTRTAVTVLDRLRSRQAPSRRQQRCRDMHRCSSPAGSLHRIDGNVSVELAEQVAGAAFAPISESSLTEISVCPLDDFRGVEQDATRTRAMFEDGRKRVSSYVANDSAFRQGYYRTIPARSNSLSCRIASANVAPRSGREPSYSRKELRNGRFISRYLGGVAQLSGKVCKFCRGVCVCRAGGPGCD